MKLEITRDVVRDLWPLCRSGDASADSRTLVETFLGEDGAYAAILRETDNLRGTISSVHLSPDAERRLLDDARGRARTRLLIVGGGIVLAALIALAALGALILLGFRAS